ALRLAYRVERRGGDVIEGLRAAGAQVENARVLGMIQEIQVHLDCIFDRYEIAPLLAGVESSAALEQLDPALRAVLVEEVKGHRGHASLVGLARTVDVEVAQPHYLRRVIAPAPPHQVVEQ